MTLIELSNCIFFCSSRIYCSEYQLICKNRVAYPQTKEQDSRHEKPGIAIESEPAFQSYKYKHGYAIELHSRHEKPGTAIELEPTFQSYKYEHGYDVALRSYNTSIAIEL